MSKLWNAIKHLFERAKVVYVLSEEERVLWNSIEDKRKVSALQYKLNGDHNRDTMVAPYIDGLTQDEHTLLKRIHDRYYGKDWYVADPLGGGQVDYIIYDDIKHRVI